jgi:hypothetical protein
LPTLGEIFQQLWPDSLRKSTTVNFSQGIAIILQKIKRKNFIPDSENGPKLRMTQEKTGKPNCIGGLF